MRADRHSFLRRLRVLLACAVMLWGAGVAVPPGLSLAADTALYAPRTASAQRTVAARPAVRAMAVLVVDRPALPAPACRLSAIPVHVDPDPLYLRHCALLL